MSGLLGADMDACEGLGLFRYKEGQTFRYHHDQPKAVPRGTPGGARVAAAYVFLSDVAAGGEFTFPKLNVSVPPKAGRALLVSPILQHKRCKLAAQP